jgi:hypothetical protein
MSIVASPFRVILVDKLKPGPFPTLGRAAPVINGISPGKPFFALEHGDLFRMRGSDER